MASKRSESPLSASILRRVAEAADGFRDGKPHWFVVTLEAPHKAVPFDSAAAARTGQKKMGAGTVVLGPYVTQPEPRPKKLAARKKAKAKKVARIEIYYEGVKKPVVIDPSKADAIFLGASALDKFAYPYYSRIHGVART